MSSSPSQMNPTAGGQAGPQSELQDAKAALAAADTQRREQLAVIRSMILQRSELTRQLQALQKRAEDAEAARDAPGAELAAASARIEELSALYASKCRSYDALSAAVSEMQETTSSRAAEEAELRRQLDQALRREQMLRAENARLALQASEAEERGGRAVQEQDSKCAAIKAYADAAVARIESLLAQANEISV